jgi:uncharacterized membrane protein YfcA
LIGDLGLFEYLIIAVAVAGSAIIKNGVGVGAGIFLLPFLTLVLPAKIALGLGAPAMLVSDIVGIRNYWREWDKAELLLLLPPAFLGVIVGASVIKSIPNRVFGFSVGAFAIVFSCFQLAKAAFLKHKTVHVRHHWFTDAKTFLTLLFGFLGGIASTLIHAGGMVMSIYLIQKPKDKRAFVGTFVLFFAITNCLKMISYVRIGILTVEILLLVAAMSPLVIVGGVVGNMLNKKVSQEFFRKVVLTIILITGIRLLLKI